MSFNYVAEEVYKPMDQKCRALLQVLTSRLKDYKIRSKILCVGSGASRLVTTNGEGFDLDYNLYITKMPDRYRKSPGELKKLVMNLADEITGHEGFRHGQDSTSAITYLKDDNTFHFDLGIVIRGKNIDFMRLINDKSAGQYIWNEVKDSNALISREKKISDSGHFDVLRDKYLNLKNRYLRNGDRGHSSFSIYSEAVNLAFQECFRKE